MNEKEFNIRKEREEQLLKVLPDCLNYKTLLYIGARYFKDITPQMTDLFKEKNYKIDVVEAFYKNCIELQPLGFNKIINADILKVILSQKYDVSMFWHGIEHIEREQLSELIEKLKKVTKKYIIFACPYGKYEQGAEYENEFENHVTHWQPEDLIRMGLSVDTIGQRDVKYGNIISWIKI